MPIFKRKDAKPRQPKTKISAPMPIADPSFSNFKSSQENLAVPGKNDHQPLTRVQSNSLSRPQPKYAPKIADVATKFGGIKLSSSDVSSVEDGTGGIEKSASMSRLVSPTSTVPPNTSPQHSNVTLRNAVSRGSTASPTRFSMISDTSFALNGLDEFRVDLGKEKSYSTLDLQLPELEVDDGLRERYVHVMKSPTGGFGFELRVSYMPDPLIPEASRPVHVLDPKTNCVASLMSGDILIEVNGVNVEFEPHERVVELIRSAGDEMEFIVRSAPDLVELNIRGALTNSPELSSSPRKIWSTQKSKARLLKGVGTLRRAGKGGTKKKVLQKHEVDPTEDRVWLVHKEGFSLGTVVPENLGSRRGSELSRQTSLVRGSRESYKVKLQTGKVLEVDEEDVEKANPRYCDRVEDLTELLHLNESSVLHVLRQRYGASLVHTFAGRHLIVINPMRQLASSYSDKVMEMFRGCRREDMPPHIFAAAQQAYHSMLSSRSDQSLVLMGVSGSGKTFNTRFLLKYLGSFADGTGTITYEKLKAIDVLLLSFANAATLLNPHGTRVTLLYSMEFDPSGNLLGMTIRTFLLEKNRAAERPSGEKNFDIFYNMLSGANDQFRSDLLLNAPVSPEETNHYVEHENLEPKQKEMATFVWEMVQKSMTTLNVSEEEAKGIWSLIAAIYHLGYAGVRKGAQRGSEKFLNPAAAQRAAQLLGINHEDLGKDIFSPPHGTGSRLSSLFASSPIPGAIPDSTQAASPSLPRANQGVEALAAFVSGLYEHAFNALVQLINRSIQTPANANAKYSIHTLDTPGFQDPESVGVTTGTSFDNLCHNYSQERLQMLFHDSTFTAEQDRYIQESINWSFTEVAISPLPVIDVIDKNVSSRRGLTIDITIDKKGLLWILDEESIFPGASDSTFLERVQTYHHDNNSEREEPLVTVKKDTNQFVIAHCQRSMPVLYNVSGWLRRAREHPSYRVVAQVLSESKSSSIKSVFQGKGVAGSSTTLSASSLLIDSSRNIRNSMVSPATSGAKRSSVCLQTKFQLDFLIDILRKSRQWYIRCILPQPPYKIPGALMHHLAEMEEGLEAPVMGHIDIPLVRAQIRRGNIVKAARIFKQGFPEYMSFPRFRRHYECLVPNDERPHGIVDEKAAVEHIVKYLELEQSSLRIGLSQIFFRTDALVELEERVEEKATYIFTLFQAHCRRYLWKNKLKDMEIDDAAIRIIQSNIRKSNIINQWSWWKLLNKIKPLMVVRKTEAEKKEIATQLEKLKTKYDLVEEERDVLVENETKLEEKVRQLTSQLEVERLAAANAIEQLEHEQCDKRELQEQLNDLKLTHDKLKKENEETQVELMQMTLVQRIQHSEPGANEEDGDSVYLEKYRSVCRELELLKQQKNSEYDEELDDLRATKRNLERKVEGAEGELQDLRRTLTQIRKKMAKQGSEMNDLQLHLESQQARNVELEKKQKRFDAELNAARDETSQERIAKEQLSREKATMKSDMDMLQQEMNLLKSENQQIKRERDELEEANMASSDSVSEISSLKRAKRELESKIEELEDELDEVTVRSESLEQAKSRLELSLQTSRTSHQKEMESREEEMDQLQSTMNKKVKKLENQLEEALEEKHNAVKSRRDMERQVAELQAQVGDSENERALRKQLRKTRALLNDVQAQLEYEQNSSKSSNMVKTLRMQLEDSQMNEEAAHKQHRRLQNEYDELQTQNDELVQVKMELDAKVAELIHEKSELSGRIEEDQDEIEEMMSKQRTQLHQMNMLQKELAEAKGNLEDLQYEKEEAEKKIIELNATISGLEHDKTRSHTFDTSEFKVRELQQKLEFEQTTNRRLETQVHRLKAQMEKMEDAENESSNSRTENETIRRLQRQIRDLRDDISEAERKESDQTKRRKTAETELEELRAEYSTLQGELKLSQKRIESLQQALEGGDDESDNERDRTIDDEDDLSDDSYVPGNYSTHSSDDLSDTTPIRKKSTNAPYTKPLTESKQLAHGYLGKLSDEESPYTRRTRTSKSKSRSPSDKTRVNNGDDRDFEKTRRSRRSKTDETWLSRFSSDEEDRPRKHLSNSLGRHLDAPRFDNNDSPDYAANDDSSSKNFLYEDDPELAKIRAKYSKKKIEDNDD